MNSTNNETNCFMNFPFTPVFMLFKKGSKKFPYIYRSQFATQKLLDDFFQITNEFELIDSKIFDNIYEKL